MCIWFYADYKSLENYITRAQKSPLANEIMLTMSRSVAMTGDIRPTDVAAVIARLRVKVFFSIVQIQRKIANLSIFPNYFFSLIAACTVDSVAIKTQFIKGHISPRIRYGKNPPLSAAIITKAGMHMDPLVIIQVQIFFIRDGLTPFFAAILALDL